MASRLGGRWSVVIGVPARRPLPGEEPREWRRAWRTSILTLLVAAVAVLSCAPPDPAALERSPEPVAKPKLVVLLMLDTLRADRLGAYGAAPSPSPNLDALADECVLFEAAYSASNETYTTHNALFLSLQPTFALQVAADQGLRDRFPSLPARLAAAGIATAAIGQGPVFRVPALRDFASHEMPATSEEVVASAVAEIGGRGRETDRFLFVHLYDLHAPYVESPRNPVSQELYERDERLRFQEELKAEGPEAVAGAYDEGITYVDELLAPLLAELKAVSDDLEVTLVVTADHGEAFAEHRGFYEHTRYLYEEIVHVPLLGCRFPDGPAGRRNELVGSVDLAPTILELFGQTVPAEHQGRSLVGLVDGTGGFAERLLLAEGRRFGELMVRSGSLKLIQYVASREVELFDLAADPGERVDLAVERPQVVARLRRAALTYYRDEAERLGLADAVPEGAQRNLFENLRALGYLQ